MLGAARLLKSLVARYTMAVLLTNHVVGGPKVSYISLSTYYDYFQIVWCSLTGRQAAVCSLVLLPHLLGSRQARYKMQKNLRGISGAFFRQNISNLNQCSPSARDRRWVASSGPSRSGGAPADSNPADQPID